MEGAIRGAIPSTTRIAYWAPLLATFFGLQVLSQLLAVAAGLLVVRWLDVSQFAIYTIVFAVQATLMILADSGVTSSLMARGGAFAAHRGRFSEVVRTALHLRVRLQAAALAAGIPALLIVLRQHEVEWSAALLAAAAVALGLHGSVKQTVYATVLFLQLAPQEAQRAAIAAGALRVAMTAAALIVFDHWLPFVWIGTIGLYVQGVLTERAARPLLDPVPARSEEDARVMLAAFRNQFLNGIYFAVQPQITVWIMTVVGTVQSLAEVGALGRLAVGFALLSSVLGGIGVPRFARITEPEKVRRSYAGLASAMTVVGIGVLALAWAFPRALLAVLGAAYMHLEAELVWMVGASVLSLVAASLHLLNTARGWVTGIWIVVPATIAAQIAMGSAVDLSTVRGAILVQAASFAAPLAINLLIGIRGLRSMGRLAGPASAA